MELSDCDAEDLVTQMVKDDPLVWWETCVKIEDKRHALVSPVANVLQQRVGEYVLYCRAHKLPMRAVILKPRQKGISTITVGVAQWLQKIRARDGLVVGGKDWQVDNLWAIYKRYAETDTFPWGFSGYIQETKAEWGNGSLMKRQTAGGKDPGRSATIQLLLGTEVAYWGHDASVKNAGSVLTGLLACVPQDEDTMVMLESTSSGGSGLFFRKWDDAIDLEDFLQGARNPSGFVRIFAGWHEFADATLPIANAKEEADILAGIGARNDMERHREQQLRARYNLTAGQIKYWRKLLSDSDNDPDKRDREYPTTPEDAFRAAQPCRFNLAMLRQMRAEALLQQGNLQWVMLDKPDQNIDRYVLRLCMEPEEANYVISERPEIHRRYSIHVDTAGARAKGDDKKDTDCHAVVVIRDGYFDTSRGMWVRPAVVATIKPKQRGDIDLIEEWVWRLHVYYGKCLVVPEANYDRGLIRGLRQRGCHIYEEERPATDVQSHKPSGKYGFWTSEKSRNWIIENLARAIRELDKDGEGLFCPFLWILDELEHFATDPDTGKAEAMDGWHDDWVLALAIGMATKAGSTTYFPPQLPGVELPRDLRDTNKPGGGGADRL